MISKNIYDKIIQHYGISKSDLKALFNKYLKFKDKFKGKKDDFLKQIYFEHYNYLKNLKFGEFKKIMNYIIFKNEVI